MRESQAANHPKSRNFHRAEINVTPLVDVCLVLLIIFMVVSEQLVRGVNVPLPQTRHHASPRDDDRPVVSVLVTLHDAGSPGVRLGTQAQRQG
jgi:biopolymer transport protein ExbD